MTTVTTAKERLVKRLNGKHGRGVSVGIEKTDNCEFALVVTVYDSLSKNRCKIPDLFCGYPVRVRKGRIGKLLQQPPKPLAEN